jgi:hypothetical protein
MAGGRAREWCKMTGAIALCDCIRKGSAVPKLELIATIIWAGTACFGLYLLFVWLSHGGLRQQSTRITVFPAALIFAHPLLATTGLTLWVAFLFSHRVVYAWSGFGVLSGSAMLGFVMLTRWLVGRGGKHARGAEQHFPARVVAMHGAVGLTTFALVLIASTLATRHP